MRSSDVEFNGLTLEGLRSAIRLVYETKYNQPIQVIDQPYLDYLREQLNAWKDKETD